MGEAETDLGEEWEDGRTAVVGREGGREKICGCLEQTEENAA